jgi:pyruvate kinase
VPVLAISPRLETVRRLALLFGVTAIQSPPNEDIRALLDDCGAIAAQHGVAHSGELIGILAGLPDQDLGTNLFEVHRVP